MKIAINGFGRIGRQIFRQAYDKGIGLFDIERYFLNRTIYETINILEDDIDDQSETLSLAL